MSDTLLEDLLSELEIRAVNELLGHEQTIAPNLKRLKEAMLNIGHLVDPLIVDKESGTVLDGNHRLKVLQIIECPFAVCQTVDYKSDKICVGTWVPLYREPIDELIAKASLKLEKTDCDEGRKAVDSLKAPFMWVKKSKAKEECFLINPGGYKLKENIEEQNFIIGALNGTKAWYIPEDTVEEKIMDGESYLYRRTYTKTEIVNTAKSHNPLPPKSTRHMIPDRVIRLNMKLGWLHESREGAAKYLHDMLSQRVYNGNVRRYSEPVIVIY